MRSGESLCKGTIMEKLAKNQTLFLWGLLLGEGECWLKDARPRLKNPEKEYLQKAGFIVIDERKPRPRSPRPKEYVSLADKTWDWAASNMHVEPGKRPTAAEKVLRALLGTLRAYMEKNRVPLVEILRPAGAPEQESVKDAVRAACLKLAGGALNSRVRLYRLRDELARLARADLDRVLLEMQADGDLALYEIDDPREVTDEDVAGEIDLAGSKRRIVYLRR